MINQKLNVEGIRETFLRKCMSFKIIITVFIAYNEKDAFWKKILKL